MSNFKFRAYNKETGEEVSVFALDDYFGRHKFAYKISEGYLTADEFDRTFAPVEERGNKDL